jgi:thiol-disulfide isomerase/thioredoxin
LEQVSDEVIYPEPNGTTEVPLEINASVDESGEDNETVDSPVNGTILANGTVVNESQVNETSEEEVSESEEIPEEEPEDVDNTPEEILDEPEGDVEVTYYFFWAEYCSTCKTMMPWIREVGRAHPSLNIEMIDLGSGSSYIQRFSVSSTAVSVIIKRVDGEDVSGTKMIGFMDQDGIERLACSELDDESCEDKYPK